MSSSDQDPFTLLEGVHDEASFVAFVAALADDFAREREIEAQNPSSPYGAGALGWQNDRIDTMLECASAYARSTQNRGASHPNPWYRAAEILYMGKIYE
jgi:hypothetical protein